MKLRAGLDEYKGMKVLITGGMGFIGSNLANALVALGANVTIVDAMLPGYGGNIYNIRPIQEQITVNFSDVRDTNVMDYLVRDQDMIFHLAGQVDHILSLQNPFPDIDINIKGTAVVMEACKHNNPKVRVIYTGTRGQYGPALSLPVNEEAPTNPKGIYEVSRLSAEKIVKIYNDIHGIRSVMLRLTNIYGPRAQMRHSRYGVVNWFVRLALDDQCIPVFGDGSIMRDFLYVSDCVEALLLCGMNKNVDGQILNVGIDKPSNFLELADKVVEACGSGSWEFAPFSPERKAQEPRHFYSDITKIRQLVGWEPTTDLLDGLKITAEYYRKHKDFYW